MLDAVVAVFYALSEIQRDRTLAETVSANPLLLENIYLFQDLTNAEKAEVAKYLKVMHFAKSLQILVRHETGDDVHFICRGKVRVTIFSQSGKEASYQDKSEGELFGELSAIDGRTRAADVIALTETTTLQMTQSDFVHIIREYPSLNQRLLQSLVHNIRGLTDRVFEFTAMDVPTRIRSELLRLATGEPGRTENFKAQPVEVVLEPAPKHADIASRVSTTREAVTREINVLLDAGLIDKSGRKTLTVCNVRALAESIHS